eukprot:SAG25_NODE_908_length_4802_cov_2.234106_8_plen_142_part_00
MGSVSATHAFIHQQRPGKWVGASTYDLHSDGSGICHVSAKRPMLTTRPGEGIWQFPADSHLVSFLHHRGIAYDVLTDEHLHEEGVSCLSPYRCVITGTHPEYYSSAMLRGINEFTHSGGRLVYLVSIFATVNDCVLPHTQR